MRKYIHRNSALSLLALALVAACGEKTPEQTPVRQVELTPPATPAVQPPINDTPATPPSKSTKPKAATPKQVTSNTVPGNPPPANQPPVVTPPPRPSFGVVAAGTQLVVRPTEKMCTNNRKPGDHITATVADDVTGNNGAVIPAGATATLEVVESQFGNNDADKIKLSFRVVSLAYAGNTYDVTGADVVAPPVTKVRRQSNGDQAKKIGAGAAIGAIVGKVAGGSTRATVIGGAVGAAGGTAVAMGTADYDGCVAADARLTVTLSQDLRVHAGN